MFSQGWRMDDLQNIIFVDFYEKEIKVFNRIQNKMKTISKVEWILDK